MKKITSIVLCVIWLVPAHSMFLSDFFTTSKKSEQEEELIEKTKNPKYIFIDLNTLYQTNKTSAENKVTSLLPTWLTLKLGYEKTKKTMSGFFSKSVSLEDEIQEKLFGFLKDLDLSNQSLPTSKYTITTSERILPPVFSTFFLLKNKEEEKTLRDFIKEALDKSDHEEDMKTILGASVDVMFNADDLNVIMQLNDTLYTKAKKLKQAGHTLVLTGNIPWHAYTDFLELDKANPLKELFEHDHRFISSKLQLLTPQKKFYRTVFNTLNASAEKCIIINEKTANMQKACCLGATLVKFRSRDLERFNTTLEDALKIENNGDDE